MNGICYELHHLFASRKPHRFLFDSSEIPENGIYVLFEEGESAHATDRIVRIGTHTGDEQLRSRLNQHFVNENKDRSIFRKNIGRAILNRDNDPFLEQWEIDLTTRAAKTQYASHVDMEKQAQVEKQVTASTQTCFKFVVFPVLRKDERLFWESRIIATVSRCPDCRPSPGWLGLSSPKEKIR